ncbi:MAG: ATP-binding protein, partial [Acetobacter cibinongensis]
KYAFPDGRSGIISISLTHADKMVTLNIGDNGIGCTPDQCDISGQQGIGLKLIKGFARQLNATFVQNCQNGTHYSFVFPLEQK